MFKLSQLDRILAFQQAMGLTGVHYHAHGSEPSDPEKRAAFHARRLGIAAEHMKVANERDCLMTRGFWSNKPEPATKDIQPRPGL